MKFSIATILYISSLSGSIAAENVRKAKVPRISVSFQLVPISSEQKIAG